MVNMIGLDFETYGAVDLNKHGLARYVSDSSFTPLIGSTCMSLNGVLHRQRFDFVHEMDKSKRELHALIGSSIIVAHNAGFEQVVLRWLGMEYQPSRFVDSAVVARTAGAGGHLEAAAPQLLDVVKMAAGHNLIKTFSVPTKYQEASGDNRFDPQVIVDNPVEWEEFGKYCDLDAELGLRIAEVYGGWLSTKELHYMGLTMLMNDAGWPVDISLVQEMQRRYLENMEQAEFAFMSAYPDSAINLRSLKQMKEWCAKRGIKAKSFDEAHVASLFERIQNKVWTMPSDDPKMQGYEEVLHLLRTKKVLGGSSLKKLQVIIDVAVPDEHGIMRVKDQYVHCGAGQTLRTSGRSVQMQNLKRLSSIEDMDELDDPDNIWDNSKLAENLRQAFCSSDTRGELIVGDFKSVESRGLAYLAGEAWKLNAYKKKQDIYQVLADKFGNTRTFGKVGELSCGYGAGGGAVQSFAAGMGVTLTEGEANGLVRDWRDECPRTVEFWQHLNDMLHLVIDGHQSQSWQLDNGLSLQFRPVVTPASLIAQHQGVQSVEMALRYGSTTLMKRFFHGCYRRGGNIAYYKPSDRKTGDLWRGTFTDPKTKQLRYYELYGGKLAGILTQSFCREIFMATMSRVYAWTVAHPDQLTVIGQFHDEIVVDWVPGRLGLSQAKQNLQEIMSTAPHWVPSFPLDADIKSAYRYIK